MTRWDGGRPLLQCQGFEWDKKLAVEACSVHCSSCATIPCVRLSRCCPINGLCFASVRLNGSQMERKNIMFSLRVVSALASSDVRGSPANGEVCLGRVFPHLGLLTPWRHGDRSRGLEVPARAAEPPFRVRAVPYASCCTPHCSWCRSPTKVVMGDRRCRLTGALEPG